MGIQTKNNKKINEHSKITKISTKNKIQDEFNVNIEESELGIPSSCKSFLMRGSMQTSRPCELVSAYKNNCVNNTETISTKSHNCQKSAKTNSSSISGKNLQKQNISGVVSVCSKEANKPGKQTIKSDSNKTSKSTEDFFQSYSPLNWDTPSFTENLNTYDFVTDKRDNFYGNSNVLTFHGPDENQLRGPTIHDTAFCNSLERSFDASMTNLDQNILEDDDKQKKFASNQRDNN